MPYHLILINNAFLGMDQYNVIYNHFTPLVQDVRSPLGVGPENAQRGRKDAPDTGHSFRK